MQLAELRSMIARALVGALSISYGGVPVPIAAPRAVARDHAGRSRGTGAGLRRALAREARKRAWQTRFYAELDGRQVAA